MRSPLAILALTLALATTARADERLLGTWLGAGPENQGQQVTVERNAIVLDGERLPARFPSPGVIVVGAPGEEGPLTYTLEGDTLVVSDEGAITRWRRAAPTAPQPRPQPTPTAAPAPPGSPFARRFQGEGVTLSLSLAPDGALRGQLAFQGQLYPVEARADGPALRGSFQADGHAFALQAQLAGQTLTLTSGGQTYRLLASGGAAPAPATDPGPIVMTQHTFRDPAAQNMPSHTLLVPKGWTVEGGAWWANPQRYFNVLPSQDIGVRAPDGREVRLSPSIVAKDIIPAPQLGMQRPAEGSADQGYPVLHMPDSLEGWKQWLLKGLQQTYPDATGARVDNAVVVPELTAALLRQLEPLRQMAEQNRQRDASIGMRVTIDAAVLAFECRYTQSGQDWEQLVIFGTSFQTIDSQWTGRQVMWEINPSLSYRAPAGRLESSMPLLVAIANSFQVTPQWSQMRAELQAKLNKIAMDGARAANRAAAERSRLLAKTNSEISDIIHKGYQDREAIRDSTHRKVINSIHGTEDYVVPGGTTAIELPNTYERVYTNGNGEYLLTNDQLYDPNTDPRLNGATWQGMEARR